MIQRLTDIKTNATAAFEKESKRLLVRIDEDKMLLALVDKTSGEWDAVDILTVEDKDWQNDDTVQEIKRNSTLAAYSNLETHLLAATKAALLIPKALLENAELFWQTQFGKYNTSAIKTQVINEEIAVAYYFPEHQANTLGKLFPKAIYGSTLALLVKQLINLKEEANKPVLYLSIYSHLAEIALVKEGKFLLGRSVSFIGFEDVLYHLLHTCHQLNVSTEDVSVRLLGDIGTKSNEVKLLQTYFAQVGFTSAQVSRHPAFQKVPAHCYTGLMEVI